MRFICYCQREFSSSPFSTLIYVLSRAYFANRYPIVFEKKGKEKKKFSEEFLLKGLYSG